MEKGDPAQRTPRDENRSVAASTSHRDSLERSQIRGGVCPHCGQPFAKRRWLPAWTRRATYTSVAVLSLVVVGIGTILWLNHDPSAKRRHAATLMRLEGQREQVEEETKNVRDAERRLPGMIARDASGLARLRKLGGPILGVACTPMNGPNTRGLGASVRSYNCIAIQRRRGRTIEGARFFATIDAHNGAITFGGD
jgi:hypothetical protein